MVVDPARGERDLVGARIADRPTVIGAEALSDLGELVVGAEAVAAVVAAAILPTEAAARAGVGAVTHAGGIALAWARREPHGDGDTQVLGLLLFGFDLDIVEVVAVEQGALQVEQLVYVVRVAGVEFGVAVKKVETQKNQKKKEHTKDITRSA